MIQAADSNATLAALLDQVREASEQLARVRRVDTSGVPADRAALTVSEVAGLLQVSPETIREWFYAGKFQGLQTGNRILIWRWSVLEFVGLTSPDAPAKKKARH